MAMRWATCVNDVMMDVRLEWKKELEADVIQLKSSSSCNHDESNLNVTSSSDDAKWIAQKQTCDRTKPVQVKS